MALEADYLGALETHSPEGIRAALAGGASPTALSNGRAPVEELIGGYLRSARFASCLRVLLEAGASMGEPVVQAVLLDDDVALMGLLQTAKASRRLSLPCAFTCCEGVTPLHLCAEFNSVRCARALLAAGADVDAAADRDADGLGGQTPVFHAVNSILNYGRPSLELLVDAGARLDVRLKGLVWGPGADWETVILDVTPLSYAQCGLFAQLHRKEADVYSNLAYLYAKRYGTEMPVRNVPNRYLVKG